MYILDTMIIANCIKTNLVINSASLLHSDAVFINLALFVDNSFSQICENEHVAAYGEKVQNATKEYSAKCHTLSS